MENEDWKPIPGYEGLYEISNLGRVRGKRYKKPRTGAIAITGYHMTSLTKCGEAKPFLIHRLVAAAFLDNAGNLPIVNHINGIKTDNRAKNLEWVTGFDNYKHAVINKLSHPQTWFKSVKKICAKTNAVLDVYETIRAAARSVGKTYNTSISKCAQGKSSIAHGFKWEFLNNQNERNKTNA